MGNNMSAQQAYNNAKQVKLEDTPNPTEDGILILNTTDNYYYWSHSGAWVKLDKKYDPHTQNNNLNK